MTAPFSIFREIIALCLFPNPTERDIVVLSQILLPDNFAERGPIGGSTEYIISSDLFPNDCRLFRLKYTDSSLEQLTAILQESQPSRVFLYPSWLAKRHLKQPISVDYPYQDLFELYVRTAIENLGPGVLLGTMLPYPAFATSSTRGFRDFILQHTRVRFLIELSFSIMDLYPFLRSQLLILETGHKGAPLTRFFQLTDTDQMDQQSEILSDFSRLLNQDGGTTTFGYVLRDELSPDISWLFDRYHPRRKQELQDMETVGKVQRLGDLVSIRRGIKGTPLIDGNASGGVPVLEGRDILANNALQLEAPRYRMEQPPSRAMLMPGDLCMPAIWRPTNLTLPIARIEESHLPRVASNNVLVLRPNPEMTSEEADFLFSYLQSDLAADQYRLVNSQLMISPVHLRELPVPVPDSAMQLALASLRSASEQFSNWQAEAKESINALFRYPSMKAARIETLTAGRRIRQRINASHQVDDFHYRLRTQYPHPIAYRWRAVESAKPDLEGYGQILECAEVATCYLACMALALTSTLKNVRIGYISTMAERITKRGSGTNMGDWISILREARDSKQLRNLPEIVPFYEVLRFLDDQNVDDAIQELKAFRDDQSHRRGPKGGQVREMFDKAKYLLERLLKAVEFLSEYPLRYIESTRRDSIRGITEYQYRDLVGDHPLVPLSTGTIQLPELEAHSLYLVDREGGLRLLRPLLTRRECPECGAWATFYLDGYHAKMGNCTLVSMEHSHTHTDTTIAEAFRFIGLLQ